MYRAALALVQGDPAGADRARRRALDAGRRGRPPTRWRLRRCPGWPPGRAGTSRPRTAATRPPERSDPRGHIVRRARLLDRAGRPGDHRRVGSGRRGGSRASASSSPAHGAAGGLRGTADMFVGLSQLALGSATTSTPPAAPAPRRRAGRAGRAARRTRYRWRVAMARLREAEGDLAGPSTCSTRPSGCTSATSPRTCGRSPPSGRACSIAQGDAGRGRATGRSDRGCPRTTSCHTSASTSTSPWPGSCSPSTATRADAGADRAARLLDRLRRPPRRAAGPAP